MIDPTLKKGVLFMKIRNGQCRWPMWKHGEPHATARCCGEATRKASSYCQHHYEVSRGIGTRGERNALNKVPEA